MPRLKRYIIHATCHYVVKSKETGATEKGTSRPTISVEASSEASALAKARKKQEQSIGSDYWPCVHLSLNAELVNVVGA